MGNVPRCCFGSSKPTGLIFMVTARPTIFGHGHIGRTPYVAPVNPKRSMPSDTAQVSSFNKRSTMDSRAIGITFVVAAHKVLRFEIPTQNPKPETYYDQYAKP